MTTKIKTQHNSGCENKLAEVVDRIVPYDWAARFENAVVRPNDKGITIRMDHAGRGPCRVFFDVLIDPEFKQEGVLSRKAKHCLTSFDVGLDDIRGKDLDSVVREGFQKAMKELEDFLGSGRSA